MVTARGHLINRNAGEEAYPTTCIVSHEIATRLMNVFNQAGYNVVASCNCVKHYITIYLE